jgi:hypothetical protein
MMGWLEDNGVPTKIEDDGRVFPQSNNSQTIIDCFIRLCHKHHIGIQTQFGVTEINAKKTAWEIKGKDQVYKANKILVATGSSGAVWKILALKGYQIVEPVPSLFTFNIKHPLLKDLLGVSVPQATVNINHTKHSEGGPLLITHWGLSGPAVLKLSAWAARELHDKKYHFEITVNWSSKTKEAIIDELEFNRKQHGKKKVSNLVMAALPKRLWHRMLQLCHVPDSLNYASLNSTQIEELITIISASPLPVNGKSTFKDEFVTSGGVDGKDINFKTMQSKLHPGLYFAGEVLNIDAVTGGFNFQAAWTTAFLAARSIAEC